jgi:hypothetical protein
MSVKEKLEDKIVKTERRLKEFAIRLKRLDREYQRLLEELALTPEQLKDFAENPANFDPPIWEQLQNEKKKRDEILTLEIESIPDPNKTKQATSERGKVQQHWLYVR